MIDPGARGLLERAFHAAVAASAPAEAVKRALPKRPNGRTVVVGAGKAAAQMAEALVEAWDGPLGGVVVTRTGHTAGARTGPIEVLEASHPTPDATSERAAARLLDAVSGLTANDLVIALISGGGSALLCRPLPGLSLADKQAVTLALLSSGATIGEMNRVRQRLSGIKGGRLAEAAAPARVVTLAISDVPGDLPDIIASGPTVAARGEGESAEQIIARYRLELPAGVASVLLSPASRPPRPERLPPGEFHIIASPQRALQAAAAVAREAGIAAHILSDRIEGEAREVGRVLAAIAQSCADRATPFPRPVMLLSGGETTVTLRAGGGRGGRNGEFALGAALALRETEAVTGLAADTDGIDGSEDNAGAFFDGATAARMTAAGIDPFDAQARHDSWGAFASVDQLFVTGPTGTNVNDFRAFLVG